MILDGRAVQREIKVRLKGECELLRSKGITPNLHVLEWGSGEPSVFAKNIVLCGEEVGAKIAIHQVPPKSSLEEIRGLIQELNEASEIHGILVLTPIPSQIDKVQLGLLISPLKDIDALNPLTLGKLFLGQPFFIPSTAKAVIKLLDFYRVQLEGKRVVILGRSPTVGKPLSLLFLARNATVTVCHSYTKDLPALSRQAEILVSAMGVPRKVDRSFVKEGAIVIDVGTTVIGDKIIGDVRFEEVLELASWITPVPGGVGSVTTAALLENLIEAIKVQNPKLQEEPI